MQAWLTTLHTMVQHRPTCYNMHWIWMGISCNVVDIKAKLCSQLVWQQSEIRRSVWAKETPVNFICRLLHSGYSTIWSGQMREITEISFFFCWSPILSLSVSNQTSHSHTKVSAQWWCLCFVSWSDVVEICLSYCRCLFVGMKVGASIP